MASQAQRLKLQDLEDLHDHLSRFQDDYLALHWEWVRWRGHPEKDFEEISGRMTIRIALLRDDIVELVENGDIRDRETQRRHKHLKSKLEGMISKTAALKVKLEGGRQIVYRDSPLWKSIAENKEMLPEESSGVEGASRKQGQKTSKSSEVISIKTAPLEFEDNTGVVELEETKSLEVPTEFDNERKLALEKLLDAAIQATLESKLWESASAPIEATRALEEQLLVAQILQETITAATGQDWGTSQKASPSSLLVETNLPELSQIDAVSGKKRLLRRLPRLDLICKELVRPSSQEITEKGIEEHKPSPQRGHERELEST